jgi:ferredoxin-thioredoxin reductase catalytic subunit
MFEEDDAYRTNLNRLMGIARLTGCILNADDERRNKVIGLMTRNFKDFGRYYCPCKQSHPLDPAKDILCPCAEIEEELAAEGHCFCRLFYKPAAAE